MLNDPEFDKMIIYGLAGVCCVLLLAVIFLAVKRNIYYVDEEGREVPSPKQQAKRALKFRKTEKEKETVTPEVISEPEVIAAPEPVEITPEEPEEILVPAFSRAAEVPEEVFPQEPEEGEDLTGVMRFTIDSAEPEQPEEEQFVEEEPVIEEAVPEKEPAHLQLIDYDDEPEAEPVCEEEPQPAVPKVTGLVVTVTVGTQSETHEIDELPCLIGREQTSCNLVISEPAVSRRHARIYVNEDGLFIEDVSEHNGTYLNGTKLPSLGSAPLKEDDRVSLGRAEIVVSRVLY